MQIKSIVRSFTQPINKLFTRIKSAVTNKGFATGNAWYPWGGLFTWGGQNKTWQLQGGYANKIVYAYANVLVTKLIEVPQVVYLVKDEMAARKAKAFNFGNDNNITGRYNVLELKALQEIEKHPLIKLTQEPNPYQTGMEMMEAFWFNYIISGDGYLWAQRAEGGRDAGQPIYLHNIPANLILPVREGQDINAPVTYYLFTTWAGLQIKIDPADILHLSQWSPFDPILGGYSPTTPGAKTIATNEANQEAQGRAFVNGSTGIIISSEVGVTTQGDKYDTLTPEQVNDIKQTLNKDWKGAPNNQGTHVTNGKVVVTKLGDTLADLQLCEAEKTNWRDGGALFNVNPILVGDMSGGTDNNVQTAYKALVLNNVIPKLRKFDMAFKRWVVLWFPKESLLSQHDIKKFTELSPDQKLMNDVFGKAPWLTYNEIRKLFDFEEDQKTEGMNTYIIPGSMKTIEQIIDGAPDPVVTADINQKYLDYVDR